MSGSRHKFAGGIRISSEHFASRVEALFGNGTLRPELDDFWARHSELISDWTREHCSQKVHDGYVRSARIMQEKTVTLEQVQAITTELFLSIFKCKKEAQWMKGLASIAISSWLVDNEEAMLNFMSGYGEGLMRRLWDSSQDPQQTFSDILFVNRLSMMEFEVIASFRTELELRYSETEISRKGNEFVSSLGEKMGDTLQASEVVNKAAGTAKDKITDLRSDTTQAAAISQQSAQAMQDAARAAGDLLKTLHSVTDGLSDGRDALAQAVQQAEQSANDNARVAEEVAGVEQVLRTINEIADQTNILALNATIEAARAGESGAGFAVVAAEVKHLAGETAKATETVAKQISAIQSTSQQSKESCRDMLETNQRLRETSEQLHSSLNKRVNEFSQITDAVDETAKGAASIGELVANINRDTDTVSEVVEHLSTSTREAAGKLASMVEDTSSFVDEIGNQA